jgi:uncharacterized protein YbjT (DUF2867 family)
MRRVTGTGGFATSLSQSGWFIRRITGRHAKSSVIERLNMKILVTTPTGNIGRRIVRELLAPEFCVRVLVRDPARLPEEVRAHLEVVPGSLDDGARLRRALDGVEAMFFCVPPASGQTTDIRAHYERFARVAAAAIRTAGTPRVVTISAVGKGRARNAGPISGLHAMEDILNESGAAIRHLHCGAFMENFLCHSQAIAERGVLSYPMPGHVAIPMVAATDVADMALRWLVRRDWSGVAGGAVHGPEDLSYNQAAATIERVLERPVRYQEVAANTYVQSLVRHGASTGLAQSLVAMFAELATGITHAEPRTAETTTATKLSDWVREELLPLIAANVEVTPGVDCNA